MSGAPALAFWALTGLLAAALWVLLASKNPRRRTGAESLLGGCVAGLLLLLDAPLAALMAAMCGVGGVLMTADDEDEDGGDRVARRSLSRVSAALVTGLLGFVWIGMMARQFLSAGVDLSEYPGFGDFGAGVARWLGQGTLSVVMLVVGILVVAGVQSPSTRRPS